LVLGRGAPKKQHERPRTCAESIQKSLTHLVFNSFFNFQAFFSTWSSKTPKNKSMSKMFYKKYEKNSMSFSPSFSFRFWMFLCVGSLKTPKENSRKKSPKTSNKAPSHLRANNHGGAKLGNSCHGPHPTA
jgi:hypothetical protein